MRSLERDASPGRSPNHDGERPHDDAAGDPHTSVDKALALLSAFSSDRPTMGVSELARRTDLPKSTAHRLLASLVSWELVVRNGTMYTPGTKLAELSALSSSHRLRHVALPHLQELYESTHETVHLAILDKLDVIYVDKLHGHNGVAAPSQVGGRMPAHCTAIGKAILANSRDPLNALAGQPLRRLTGNSICDTRQLRAEFQLIRSLGIAYDRQESAVGLTCVAAPIIGVDARPVGAISVAGPTRRFRPAAVAPIVRATAARIAALVHSDRLSQLAAESRITRDARSLRTA